MSDNVTTHTKALDVIDSNRAIFDKLRDTSLSKQERIDTVRIATSASSKMGNQLTLMQGELLYEINHNSYEKDWGYNDTWEYAEKELGFKKRKAQALISIFEKLAVDLELDPTELRRLGEWSKTAMIVPIIDKTNVGAVFDALDILTQRQTKKFVLYVKDGMPIQDAVDAALKDEEEDEDFKSMNFRLSEEQYENATKALASASHIADSHAPGHLLDLVCTDFLTSNVDPTEVLTEEKRFDLINQAVERISRSYGIELEIRGPRKEND